ncbi:ubiquinol-cytochrome c reductase core subunit 1 [Ceratobasidium sp. 428]|nr:ubiquinol-cytochrome c reductase core subunit 1 [Ceratobasidium sp. 428]
MPYSDAVLSGVLVRAGTAAEASGLGADEAKRAVAKVKFVAAASLEGREGLATAVFGAPKADLASVHAALDKVSESSVTKTLSLLIKAKPTYVALGDLHGLPYADELGL